MFKNPLIKSFFLLWCAHLFMDFFTGIWPIYKTIAQIDITKAGLIAGISGFLGEILQIGFGYFCDRGHRKKLLLIGIFLASCILWITFTINIPSCFMILLILMIGSGSFHPAAVGMVGIISREQKGKGILFFASGGAIGYAVSQLTFTKAMQICDGHAYILFIPVVLLLFFLMLHKFPAQQQVPPTISFKGFFQPILHCRKPLLLLYLSQVANQALVTTFLFFLPDLLRTKECHSWLCMGGGHCCFILGSALTMIPAGFLCDKYGQKKVLLTVLLLAVSTFYFFLNLTNFPLAWSMGVLAFLGASMGIINPIIISWGNRLVPESPSTVSAILMGFAWCLSHLGTASAGILATLFPTQPIVYTLLTLGLLLVACIGFVLFMPSPQQNPSLAQE